MRAAVPESLVQVNRAEIRSRAIFFRTEIVRLPHIQRERVKHQNSRASQIRGSSVKYIIFIEIAPLRGYSGRSTHSYKMKKKLKEKNTFRGHTLNFASQPRPRHSSHAALGNLTFEPGGDLSPFVRVPIHLEQKRFL